MVVLSAGYNDFQPDVGSDDSSHDHLWTLDAVRERSHMLLDIGLEGKLPHFEVRCTPRPSSCIAAPGVEVAGAPLSRLTLTSWTRRWTPCWTP
jgi:hypothetical protein